MTPTTARRLDAGTAALCGAFVGTASGLALLGSAAAPPWPVVVAIFVAAAAAATVAALIATAYAKAPWSTD